MKMLRFSLLLIVAFQFIAGTPESIAQEMTGHEVSQAGDGFVLMPVSLNDFAGHVVPK